MGETGETMVYDICRSRWIVLLLVLLVVPLTLAAEYTMTVVQFRGNASQAVTVIVTETIGGSQFKPEKHIPINLPAQKKPAELRSVYSHWSFYMLLLMFLTVLTILFIKVNNGRKKQEEPEQEESEENE